MSNFTYFLMALCALCFVAFVLLIAPSLATAQHVEAQAEGFTVTIVGGEGDRRLGRLITFKDGARCFVTRNGGNVACWNKTP